MHGPYLLGLTGVLAGISLIGYVAHRVLRSSHPTLGFGALLISLAFAWYLTSVSFVLINRQVMGGGRKFSFPATLTLQHTFYKGLLALLAVLATNFGEIRSEAAVSPAGQGRGCARVRGCCGVAAFGRWIKRKYSIDRAVWCKLIAPLAFATAADIFLSNLALRWVSVSLYTVAKSTALIFTYGLSLLLGLQGWSCSLLAAVTGVAAGVVMCSIRPTPVHVFGFIAVIVAAACSAARWVISQRFFERGGAAPSVTVLVLLQSPFTVALMAPLAAAEAPDLAAAAATHSEGDVVAFALMGILGGLLAFLLLAVELQLIALTSALTANVIGHLKDIVAIAGSVLVLQEELSLLNGSGAALTVLSALAYSALKARKAVRARRAGVHSRLDDLEPGLDVGDDPIDAGDADADARARGRSDADAADGAGAARSRGASVAGTGDAAVAAVGKGAKVGASATSNRYAPVALATPAPAARDRRLYSIGSDDDDDADVVAVSSVGPSQAASPVSIPEAGSAAAAPAAVVVSIRESASAVAGDEKRRGAGAGSVTTANAPGPSDSAALQASAGSVAPAAPSSVAVPGKLLRPSPAAKAASSAVAAPSSAAAASSAAATSPQKESSTASGAGAAPRALEEASNASVPPQQLGSPDLASAVHVAIASLEEQEAEDDSGAEGAGPHAHPGGDRAGDGTGNNAASASGGSSSGMSGVLIMPPPSATASSASSGERKQLLAGADGDGSDALGDDVVEEASPARA